MTLSTFPQSIIRLSLTGSLLLTFLIFPSQQVQMAALYPGETITGQPGQASLSAMETFTEVAAREAAGLIQPSAHQIPPYQVLPGEETPAANVNPQFQEVPTAPTDTSPPAVASFQALNDNNASIPPDTHGAVGPNHLMTTLNTQVRIQDRSGNILSTVALDSFWASVNGGSSAFDPKVLYDPYGNRWMFVSCDDADTTHSGLLIAVSATNDPTGIWYKYRINAADTNWIDYPSLGFNKNWIAVTVNIYNGSGSFIRHEIYAFHKATLYAGGSAAHTRLLPTASGWAPAITQDSNLEQLYFIRRHSSVSGLLRMGTLSGVVGAESFVENAINITSPQGGWSQYPANLADFAPQLGSSQKIQNGDDRIQNVVYRNGWLWAAHTIFLPAGGTPTRSSVQWWQITPGTAPALVQNGRIDDPSSVLFYAYPSIAVNQHNDVLIGFSRFSSTQYASGNYAFRASSDPANTLRADVVLKAGEAKYYKTFDGTKNRWGDYSNTVVDPTNDIDFWTIQEYASTPNPSPSYDRWGTWWGNIAANPQNFSKTGPINGAADTSIHPTISWGTSTGATDYEFCVDKINNNGCDGSWTSTSGSTSVPLSDLLTSTTYYWQVRAVRGGSYTYANNDVWWSFTTQLDPPGLFTKVDPYHGQANILVNAPLIWTDSSNASSYEYCIDTTDDSLCENNAWINVSKNTKTTVFGLSPNVTYYWQVRAINTTGTTYADAATWWAFTTGIPYIFYIPKLNHK